MEYLSENQLNQIERYLLSNGVLEIYLLKELVDHIAISIELEMQSGLSFESAFSKIIVEYNSDELANILLDIKLNQLFPKFLTKFFLVVFGSSLFIILIIGIFLRVHQLPFRKLFQFVGAIGFGYVFIPLCFLYLLATKKNKAKTVTQFILAIVLFQTIFSWLVRWKVANFLFPFLLLLLIFYLIVFHSKFSKKLNL